MTTHSIIQGIIFDLDGTLLDTLPDIAAGINAGRRAMGLPDWPVWDIRKWIGEGLPILCERALADAPDVPVERMLPVVSAYYAAHRLDQAAAYPGIPELLDTLTTRGMPMAILSNKPHEHTVPMCEAMFSRWNWVAVEGYRQEDRRKPDPRTALDIVRAMHLAPDRVALLGDSDTDMRTAVNAGVVPVGATWGYRDRDVILAGGARHLVDTPMQVLDVLAAT
jgi:phosphoglycolate phosphatase